MNHLVLSAWRTRERFCSKAQPWQPHCSPNPSADGLQHGPAVSAVTEDFQLMARAETRLLLLPFSHSTSRGCEHKSRSTAGVKLRGYPATSLGSDGEFRQGSRWTLPTLPAAPRHRRDLAGEPWAMRQPSPPARGAQELGGRVPHRAPGTARSAPSAPRRRCEA